MTISWPAAVRSRTLAPVTESRDSDQLLWALANSYAQGAVRADRGYFTGEQIRECERAGITPLVAKPLASNNRAHGLFDKRDFVYNAKRNDFRCPAGKRAVWRMTVEERGHILYRYWLSECPKCPIKNRCTPANNRKKRSQRVMPGDAKHLEVVAYPDHVGVVALLHVAESPPRARAVWHAYHEFEVGQALERHADFGR